MLPPKALFQTLRLLGSCAAVLLATLLLVRVRGGELFGSEAGFVGHPGVARGEWREGALAAGFRMTEPAGVAPLVVRFEDTSSGGTEWQWDFGDGTRSSLRHPVHTYHDPGMYAVRQRVGDGVSFEERTELVVVDAPPPCPPQAQRGYTVLRNVPYGPEASCAQGRCFDVYLPDRPRACSPTLLYIHGGGWSEGSKNETAIQVLGEMLAGEGFFCVVMDYPLATFLPCAGAAGRSTYPGVIQDCKLAVDWIHRSGTAQLGLSDRVVVVGSSAGGHLSALLAATQGADETYFDPDPEGDYTVDRAILFSPITNLVKVGCVGNPWLGACQQLCPGAFNCRFPQGCLSTGGYPAGYPCAAQTSACRHFDAPESLVGQTWPGLGVPPGVSCVDPLERPSSHPTMPTGNAWYDASPYFWVGGSEVPFHLYHSRCDALVPAYESEDLHARLSSSGVEVTLEMTEPRSSCDRGCRHSLFQVVGVFDSVELIRELIETIYGG